MTTPESTPQPVTGRLRTIKLWDITCGYCDQGGQFQSEDHVAHFKQDHFEWTGHDDNWFEVEVTKQVPVRSRRLRSDIANDMIGRAS